MQDIIIILGTRPEAVKLAPVILELHKYRDYKVSVCNTEQQKELSNQALAFFGIKADFNLDAMRVDQSLSGLQALLLKELADLFVKNRFDAAIVQGDTMTAFCAALAAFYTRTPVFHLEAGLRSYNLLEPFPEEALRQMTARIACLHFAPTQRAEAALKSEGISTDKIILTGNTVIDALFCLPSQTLKAAEESIAERAVKPTDKTVLVTVHRRENHGERLDKILEALVELAVKFHDHEFILPVHPNPNVRGKVHAALGKLANVYLTEPLDYPELVSVMKSAKLILTDSGGIQEEAPSFGAPVLVMRYETERTEGVEAGFAKLVGAQKDLIISEAAAVLSLERAETRLNGDKNPYGDGCAAQKVEKAIREFFNTSSLKKFL
ncbi:MAG: UDP-N-acetylglucosamine 2-epimerase (non-hydrolyzing) [Deferribacteraceae bacterium]|jgi:UDP-N-acetylglucosamine 2-epimerase (non-hydrolysing)|nr:UDP-N-acetylglucosamine 2-epimerase (non-hydrolyzing) [Deferribacteraceae bacterium]